MTDIIAARSGKAVALNRGQSIKVINTHDTQVVFLNPLGAKGAIF